MLGVFLYFIVLINKAFKLREKKVISIFVEEKWRIGEEEFCGVKTYKSIPPYINSTFLTTLYNEGAPEEKSADEMEMEVKNEK